MMPLRSLLPETQRITSYEGVTVLRNGMGNVTRMYVKQGYAGSKTVYGLRTDGEKEMWDAGEVERPDTDILYYDLAGLRLTEYLWDDESPEHSSLRHPGWQTVSGTERRRSDQGEIFFC